MSVTSRPATTRTARPPTGTTPARRGTVPSSHDTPTPARDRRAVGVALGVAAVMIAIGAWGIDRGSMWQDEAATYEVAHRTLPQIVAMVRRVDVVHAAYYAFMHVWMQLGTGEVWLRVPSVAGAGVAAGAVAALGVRLGGLRLGLVAGLLYAVAPLISFYAQEGRSFALVSAAVLLGTYALVRACDLGRADVRAGTGPTRRGWWVMYALCLVGAVVVHEFAVLAVLAHGVTVVLARVPWRTARWWLGSAALAALVVAPIAVKSQRQSGQVSWLDRPDGDTLVVLAHQFFGSTGWMLVLVAALVALGTGAEVRRWLAGRRTGLGVVALPLLVLPVVLLLTVSLVQPLYHVRYVLFSFAGVPLLAARGAQVLAELVSAAIRADRFRRPVAWGLAVLVVVAVAVGQLPAQRHERTVDSRNNDLAGIAAAIRAQAQPGDGVLFMPQRYRSAALAYPDAFTAVTDVARHQTGIQAHNLRGTDLSRRAVTAAMLDRDRIWVVGRSGLTVRDGENGALNVQATLKAHFRKDHAVRVHGMQVALYVRKQ